jgi:hypothetical protein
MPLNCDTTFSTKLSIAWKDTFTCPSEVSASTTCLPLGLERLIQNNRRPVRITMAINGQKSSGRTGAKRSLKKYKGAVHPSITAENSAISTVNKNE